jgi:IS5 family transposase
MPPKSSPPVQPELFRSALVNLVDPKHPLVRLAGLIDWERFRTAFGPLYRDGVGRPGLPTRLMVGLHLIKHMDGLSDEAVCARFLDSPSVPLCCGESHVQHALPRDRSSMTRWRQRNRAERLELLRAETLAAAQPAGAAEPKHVARVTVDTTVQPKAVTHPTDSKLVHRGVEIPSRNVLAGAVGDAITLVLAAAGHTLRLLRAWLIRLIAFLIGLLAISPTAPPLPSTQLAGR